MQLSKAGSDQFHLLFGLDFFFTEPVQSPYQPRESRGSLMSPLSNGLSHPGYLRAAQLTQRSAVPPQLHTDTTTNTLLGEMTDSVTRPNGIPGLTWPGQRQSLKRN